jgi:hypothetical protein
MIVVTVFVVLLGIIGFIFFQRFQSGSASGNTNTQQGAVATQGITSPSQVGGNGSSPVAAGTFDETKPWMQVAPETGRTTYTQGEDILLEVRGFAENRDINGFDILLAHDPTDMEVVSIQVTQPEFQKFQLNKRGHITITGIKRTNVTTPVIVNNTSLIKLTIRAKKKGPLEVSILPSKNKERTKFVDSNVQVILPQLKSLKLEIQ